MKACSDIFGGQGDIFTRTYPNGRVEVIFRVFSERCFVLASFDGGQNPKARADRFAIRVRAVLRGARAAKGRLS